MPDIAGLWQRGDNFDSHAEIVAKAAARRKLQSFIDNPDRDPLEILPEFRTKPAQTFTTSGMSLIELADREPDHSKTLLGDRWLCRGGSALFIGASGMGKSSAAAQMDILWSCGREAFGISPERALRVATLQAENDADDLSEMARGVLAGMELTSHEMEMVARNTLTVSLPSSDPVTLLPQLRAFAEEWKPDIVRIDPLQSFANPRDPVETMSFCHHGLSMIAREFDFAILANHHTPKTNHRDTSTWGETDWMYAGFGCAELTNWARAIMVVEASPDESGLFRFIAAKRGTRIGWRDFEGNRELSRWFRHSTKGICWESVKVSDVIKASEDRQSEIQSGHIETLSQIIRDIGGTVGKAELIPMAMDSGIAKHKAGSAITKAVAGGIFKAEKGEKNKVYLILKDDTKQ